MRVDRWFLAKGHRSLVLLAAVVGILYANAVGNQFTLDDHDYIEHNPSIRSLAGVGYLFFHPLEEGQTLRGHLYRPFSALVQYGVGQLWGYRPQPFHGVNLLLYALNAFCLLLLLRRLFGEQIAWIAVLVFVCHPVHTEVVASAVGITELLAFQFVVLALLATLREPRSPWLLAGGGICFLLALLSKETSAALPAIALLIACNRRVDGKQYLVLAVTYAVPLGVYFALRQHVIGSLLRAPMVEFAFLDNPLCSLPAGERMINAVVILLRYLRLFLAPVGLSADYSHHAIPLIASPWSPAFLCSLAVHAVLIACVWRLRRTQPAIHFGLALFYLGLLPAANLLFCGGSIMGERFLYLPSVGLALVVAAGWRLVAGRSPLIGRWSTVLGAAVLIALSCLTVLRNRDWADDETLFRKVQEVVPGNAKAHYNVAVLEYQNGHLNAALTNVREALRCYDEYLDARVLLAELSLRLGDPATGERVLREALVLDHRHEDVYVQLAEIYARTGRLAEAIQTYEAGIDALPRSMKIPYNLAMTYMALERYGQAELYLHRAIANEDLPDAHYALGHLALKRGEYAAAVPEFRLARASPRVRAAAIKFEAFCHLMERRYRSAVQVLTEELGAAGLDRDHRLLLASARRALGDRTGAREELARLGLGDARSCAEFAFPGLCRELTAAVFPQ